MGRFLEHPFWRYCVVGGGGFVVDWSILQCLVHFVGIGPVVGRVFSTLIALNSTWLLHRWFTFSVVHRAEILEWVRYMLSNGFGALVNFGVYSLIVILWPNSGLTFPLAVASIVALVVNYLGAAYFVFRSGKRS